MRVIDMFSGIGGFSLGLDRAGMRTVLFCEIDAFCQRVIAKHWPGVPIHDDAKTFSPEPGSAEVIVGGFPCQDISLAGKRAGVAGERSGLYRELVRTIRLVRPLYAILENVAALLGNGMGTVLGDLAEIGCDVEWDCIPAAIVGAPHERDRVWIVAHAHGFDGRPGTRGKDGAQTGDCAQARDIADADREGGFQQAIPRQTVGLWPQYDPANVADPARVGRGQGRPGRPPDSFARVRDEARRNAADPYGARLAFRSGFTRDAWEKLTPAERDSLSNGGQSIWPDEPALSGVDDGIPDWMDRVKATGNTIVPQIPQIIGEAIMAHHNLT